MLDSFDIKYENGLYGVYANLIGVRMCLTETKGQAEAIVNIANKRIAEEVIMNKCPSCESRLEEEFEFCPYCGQYLIWGNGME